MAAEQSKKTKKRKAPSNNEANFRTKYWCFTHFATNNEKGNYEDIWPKDLMHFRTERAEYKVTFIVYQEEKGKGNEEEDEATRGKYHIQGYMELDKEIDFYALKPVFSQRIRWSKRFGTAENCEDYCSKEDTQVVDGLRGKFGSKSTVKQGERTDLAECETIILDPTVKNKKKMLAEKCGRAVVKFHKGLEALAQWHGVDMEPKRGSKHREVYILWGAAGQGKTLFAKRLINDDSVYEPQQNAAKQLTFESYAGQEWLMFEDYNPGTIDLGALKRLTDGGDCVLPARGSGSSRQAMHDGVVITSQVNPKLWAEMEGSNNQEHYAAIKRRCTEIIQVTNTGEWIYEISGKRKSSQMPMLEAWLRKRGEWREQVPKSRLEEMEEEDEEVVVEEKQEAVAHALYQEAQEPYPDEQELWMDMPAAKPAVSQEYGLNFSQSQVVDLTQDSDSEEEDEE